MHTIEEHREKLDALIRELATATQGKAWHMVIMSIYDEEDEVIGRHISYPQRLPAPPSIAPVRLAP